MTSPDLFFVTCDDAQGGHRMAYWQWGDARSAHVVLCVHGLTRQGRDFDALAQAIVERAGGDVRVVCPDVAGRGHSAGRSSDHANPCTRPYEGPARHHHCHRS